MSDTINFKLTNRQANLLLQAAIFSSCSDITADFSNDDLSDLVAVAKILEQKIDDIDLNNLQAYICNVNESDTRLMFDDEWSQDIVEYFNKTIKVIDVTKDLGYNCEV